MFELIFQNVKRILFFRDEALIKLRNELFSRSDLPSIPLIITPALISRPQFPALRYIELIDLNCPPTTDSQLYQNWKLYQLHVLFLIIDQRIEQLPASLTKSIVSIIRFFISGLVSLTQNHHLIYHDVDDDDDRNESMEIDANKTDETDNELIEDCLTILNKRSISNYFCKLANTQNANFTSEDNEYVNDLAVIAHSLIFHRNASILQSK